MLCGAQATSLTVDNQTPGWLSSKINYGDQQTVENLTITGYINATDLSFIGLLMQKHKLNKSIDLSEAFIVGDAEREDNDISYSNIFDIQGYNSSVHIERLGLPKSITTPNPDGGASLRYIQVDTLVYGGNQCSTYNNALWGYWASGGMGAMSSPKHLVLREGVTSIAPYACDNRSPGGHGNYVDIQTVSCPTSMICIGKAAFYNCDKLRSINFPDNIEEIEAEAFQGTQILPDTLKLPNSLKQYNTTSFPLKDQQVVVIPKSVESIDNTYSTYNNTFNQWSTFDYIESSQHYYWVMNNMTPPSVKYYYQGFLKGSTIYIPHNSYAQYAAEKRPNGGFNPFSLGKLIEIIPIENISFNQASQILFIGNSLFVTPTITPSNASNQLIYWDSSNPDIASIDNTGNITAIKYGQTKITATTKEGNHSASFTLYVYEHVESIEIPTEMMLEVGKNQKITAIVKPEGKTYDKVTWKTSDPSVATIDDNGEVKGISKGQCTIIATTVDGNHKAYCDVNVIIPVESVTISSKSTSVPVKSYIRFSATVKPSSAWDISVNWSSSDENVVQIDNKGNAKAVSGGTAKIFATSNYNPLISDFCEITVMQPVTGVLLNLSTAEITVDGSLQLVATVLPENSTNKNVTWSSSDVSVAMVSGNGIVYGIKPGQATIMATTEDGGFSALCKITVKDGFIPISEITLNQTTINGVVGESYRLAASISPDNASNKSLVWQSDNEGVASVNNEGLVQLLNSGVAMIKVSATDGTGIYSECKVAVGMNSAIEDIIIDNQESVMIYSVQGLLLFKGLYIERPYLNNGIYILKTESGKTIKLIINN